MRTMLIVGAVGAALLALFLWPAQAKAAARKASPMSKPQPDGSLPTIPPPGELPPPVYTQDVYGGLDPTNVPRSDNPQVQAEYASLRSF